VRVIKLLNCPLFTTNMNVANIRTLETQSKVVLRRRKTWLVVDKEFFLALFLILKNATEKETKLIAIEKNLQLKRSVHSNPLDGSVKARMILGSWNVVWKKN